MKQINVSFASADDVPRQAFTMGIGTIMRSRKIIFAVSGKDKAAILKKALYGPVTPEVRLLSSSSIRM